MASDDDVQSLRLGQYQPEEINQILEEIHRRVATDKALKKSINFTVKPKTSDSTEWQKVYEYCGPDPDTVGLLQRHSSIWQQDPGQFVTVSTQAVHYPHPVVYVAGKCMQLDSNEAWMVILRRCSCRVLSYLQKTYKMPAEQIAQHLHASPWAVSYSRDELVEKIKQLTDAGSRYELWEQDLGVGALFVLGRQLPREL